MEVETCALEGLLLIKPRVFPDERGFFLESFRNSRYAEAGIDVEFTQDNHSRSSAGILRGLHYQSHPGQAKLMRVGRGKIFDVAVDIRPDSATFGQWAGFTLDDANHHQLFVPVGFAHGFCVLSDVADVHYKVSSDYNPDTECGLAWDDPDIGVQWPTKEPVLSHRDLHNESFAEYRARVKK